VEGVVDFYSIAKGYGFIRVDGRAEDVMVKEAALRRAGLPGLPRGHKVEFDLVTTPAGRVIAHNLRLIADDPPPPNGGAHATIVPPAFVGTISFFSKVEGKGTIRRPATTRLSSLTNAKPPGWATS
jgi:CspA family cold shock protein